MFFFLKYMLDTITGTPRNSYKIYLKYIHNFEHTSVIMNMKLSSHGLLFHRNINRRENKAQIPN